MAGSNYSCVSRSISKKVEWNPRKRPLLSYLKFFGFWLIFPVIWIMWSFDSDGLWY